MDGLIVEFGLDPVRGADAALSVWLAARNAAGEPPSSARIARVAEKINDRSSCLVLARQDGQVVGMLLAEPFRDAHGGGDRVPSWGHVSMVFVEPTAQARGVGRELMRQLIDGSRWRNLSVWTRRSNQRAQQLYRGQGFVSTQDVGTNPAGECIERLERLSSMT